MKKAYFLFVFILSALVSSGQSNFCAFDQYKSQLQSKVPGLLQQDQTFSGTHMTADIKKLRRTPQSIRHNTQ